MPEVRVGIIGVGRVFQHYFNLYNEGLLPGIRLIALFDTDNEALQRMNQVSEITIFETLDEMLNSAEVDAVFVLTPSGTHYQIAKQSILAGKPTLIEKPLCLSVSQARELQKLAATHNVYLQSVLQNRFNPAIIELRQMIKRREISEAISGGLRLRWSRASEYYQDAWHGKWSLDGGVISQQAIHHIFALDELFGPLSSVYMKTFQRKHILEAEDTAIGFVQSNSGVPFTIELTTAASHLDYEASISVVCSQGIVTIGGVALNQLKIFDQNTIDGKVLVEESVKNGYGYGHVSEIAHFVASYLSRQPDPKLEDSIRAVTLVQSFYYSVENEREVDISENAISKLLGRK